MTGFRHSGWAAFALAGGMVALAGAQAPVQRSLAPQPTVRVEDRTDGASFRLFRWRFSLSETQIRIIDLQMNRGGLARAVRQGAWLAVNGGFYAPDTRPEGLVLSTGREVSPLLTPLGGGVLSVAGGVARLHDAEAPLSLPANTDFAIQCRPRLVVNRRNNIATRTPPTAARTALCVRDEGRTLDVYLARRPRSRGRAGPTLHRFAEILVREGCQDALNLDGGPSTGAAWSTRRGVRQLPVRRGIRHGIIFERRAATDAPASGY